MLAPTQPVDESLQMVGAGCPAIDEHDAQVRSHPGNHQAGDSAAAAQIDDGAGDPDERSEERGAVLDHTGDRPPADHPQSLRETQRGDKLGIGRVRRHMRWPHHPVE